MPDLDLLVIGDINPDVILSGGDIEPIFNQVERLVDRADFVVGGSAAITAVGAARLGLRVGLCGVIGNDHLGALLLERIAAEGVDIERIRVQNDLPTGVTVVLNRGTDRAILTAPGCISALSPDDLAALSDGVARHVHAASYFLMSEPFKQRLPEVFKRFREGTATTSLDTNWDPTQQWSLGSVFDVTDILLPNRAELLGIAGDPEPSAALAAVVAHVPTVVVKLGDKGAVAGIDGVACSVRARPALDFVDAIGAGDSFNAGFLTGILNGWSAPDSVRLAVAVGTLSTAGVGGTGAQPDLPMARNLAQSLRVQPGYEELL